MPRHALLNNIDHRDLRKPARQFGRRLDMIGQPLGSLGQGGIVASRRA